MVFLSVKQLAAAIYAIAMSLPVADLERSGQSMEESLQDRQVRIQEFSEALASAVQPRSEGGTLPDSAFKQGYGYQLEVVATGFAVAVEETHIAEYVGEGRCDDPRARYHCDSGLARTYWQLHKQACRPAWSSEPGSREEIFQAARCVVMLLPYHSRRCRGAHQWGDEAGMFAGYRSVDCQWEGKTIHKRIRRKRTLLHELRMWAKAHKEEE